MKKSACVVVAVLTAVALPALAEWEVVRSDERQRLLIDPKSVKPRGLETQFKYLVDFRELQEEVGAKYQSLVVSAALRCKARTMALRGFELYSGAAGNGVLLAMPAPTPAEKRFQPLEIGSSDEDLFRRVCEKAGRTQKK